MKQIQFVGITPEQLQEAIIDGVKSQLEDLKNNFQPREPKEYLTRKEVAEMLSVDVSTVHNLSKQGVLQKRQIGGRILYLRGDVEKSIVKLNK